MRRLSIIFALFFGAIALAVGSNTAKAAETEGKSYSVQTITPKNQLNKNVSYYDLKVEPNQNQEIQLLIANTGSENIKVNAEVNNAYTTDVATIGYDKYGKDVYKHLNPSLSSLVTGERKKNVSLNPGETKTVSFKLKSPASEFLGIILGGLTTTATVNDASSKKVDVANQIRYVKGIVLHSKEDQVKPDMNLLSAAPKAYNDTNGIAYVFDNVSTININDVKVDAVIKHKNKKDIKYSANNLQIAPDSKFNYFIPIEHLKPGVYSTEITFSSKDGYSKTFTNRLNITQGKIKALDESQIESISNKKLLFIIIGVLVVILVVGLWLYMYFTGRKLVRKKERD